jgi:hypothetical protein
MKLPNGDIAVVELEKLVDYCLSPEHPRGKHKARVFQATCGLTAENADWMRDQLLQVAIEGEAVLSTQTAFGRRYVIQCKLEGPAPALPM